MGAAPVCVKGDRGVQAPKSPNEQADSETLYVSGDGQLHATS